MTADEWRWAVRVSVSGAGGARWSVGCERSPGFSMAQVDVGGNRNLGGKSNGTYRLASLAVEQESRLVEN